MTHKDVYRCFELYFPDYCGENADVWFANGKNTIRVRIKDGREFIFTCCGKNDWALSTVDRFMKTMNRTGGKK